MNTQKIAAQKKGEWRVYRSYGSIEIRPFANNKEEITILRGVGMFYFPGLFALDFGEEVIVKKPRIRFLNEAITADEFKGSPVDCWWFWHADESRYIIWDSHPTWDTRGLAGSGGIHRVPGVSNDPFGLIGVTAYVPAELFEKIFPKAAIEVRKHRPLSPFTLEKIKIKEDKE